MGPSAKQSLVPARLGRFDIAGILGQGGMGTIFLGRDRGPGGFERLVAVKTIHPHLVAQPELINMFLDEARLAAMIRHPNVVSVHEVGEYEGRHFLAMDYVSGDALSILLDRTANQNERLPVQLAAYVLMLVADGLHAAHELTDASGQHLNLVHRDVCPQNILVGYDGSAFITDFGVAKAAGQLSSTLPGVHKGKIAYMSPEQVRGEPLDRRSDIFSLGTTLWETTLSRRLFKDVNDVRSAARVLKAKVPRPSTVVKDYPADLERVVLRALCRSADDRYPTARAMADDLRAWLSSVGLPGPADLEQLMAEVCPDRLSRKRAIETRSRQAELGAGPIFSKEDEQAFQPEEDSLPFVSGDDVDLADLHSEVGIALDPTDAGVVPPDTAIIAVPPPADPSSTGSLNIAAYQTGWHRRPLVWVLAASVMAFFVGYQVLQGSLVDRKPDVSPHAPGSAAAPIPRSPPPTLPPPTPANTPTPDAPPEPDAPPPAQPVAVEPSSEPVTTKPRSRTRRIKSRAPRPKSAAAPRKAPVLVGSDDL